MTITYTDAEPRSGVVVLPAGVKVAAVLPAEQKPSDGWRITDANGIVLADHLTSRSQAIRMLGEYVEGHALPIKVVDHRGRPTGDRIG
ncbi:MAG TPA: hypothetical protein VHC43_06900 [Mycobacteriales bacterium]|nr:hypothetical protein [Mycobacteriales bacterium]